MRRRNAWTILILASLALGLCLLLLTIGRSGNFLVIDDRKPCDIILITQSDPPDPAYWTGLRLLHNGYGHELLVDARTDRVFFGRTQADWTADFIRKTAAPLLGAVNICPISADTTIQEATQAAKCLEGHSIGSVLLVVRDFHSRRSLSTFTRLLPQYHWSIATVPDASKFGRAWWRKREWIRTAVVEWEHLLWWETIDRWRYAPLQVSRISPRSE